jgi:hypothetical protein
MSSKTKTRKRSLPQKRKIKIQRWIRISLIFLFFVTAFSLFFRWRQDAIQPPNPSPSQASTNLLEVKGEIFPVSDQQGPVAIVGEEYSAQEVLANAKTAPDPILSLGKPLLDYQQEKDISPQKLFAVSLSLEKESWEGSGVTQEISGWYPYIRVINGQWDQVPSDIQTKILAKARGFHTSGLIQKRNQKEAGEKYQWSDLSYFIQEEDGDWREYIHHL